MLLGDPPDRVDVGPESVVAVEPGTPLQVRNEGGEELVLYIYGAPPEQEGADFFDDVELSLGDCRFARLGLLEDELAVLRVDANRVTFAEVAREEPERERV